jgi:hypothetical protein
MVTVAQKHTMIAAQPASSLYKITTEEIKNTKPINNKDIQSNKKVITIDL